MSRKRLRPRCALAAMISIAATSLAYAKEPDGRVLFEHRWVTHDELARPGDGVGPMHNAMSCVACHNQGGVGGGGDNGHNVDLLSLAPIKRDPGGRDKFTKTVLSLHRGFDDGKGQLRPNIVLHRFGPEGDYYDFRAKLLRQANPLASSQPAPARSKQRRKDSTPVRQVRVEGIDLMHSQRNTPALWGAGLIDSIPTPVIQEIAKSQEEHPEISGRPARVGKDDVGRFGWRGQTATLRGFVLAACANELGLEFKEHHQAVNPLSPDFKNRGNDMSDEIADALVRFVANLPRPVEAGPTRLANEATLRQGEQAFERVGCAVCHPRELGKVDGLFSDLLLHDMGPAFSDPVEPTPPTRQMEQEIQGYGGSGVIFVDVEFRDADLPREWRTPPLWGVADSAPYLHDGRAATVMEAIRLHEGEATKTIDRFNALSSPDRAAIIAFLNSLTAPAPK